MVLAVRTVIGPKLSRNGVEIEGAIGDAARGQPVQFLPLEYEPIGRIRVIQDSSPLTAGRGSEEQDDLRLAVDRSYLLGGEGGGFGDAEYLVGRANGGRHGISERRFECASDCFRIGRGSGGEEHIPTGQERVDIGEPQVDEHRNQLVFRSPATADVDCAQKRH